MHKPPGQPADLLDLIEEAKYDQTPACLYHSPASGLTARLAAFKAWQAEYGSFGSCPRSHGWHTYGLSADPTGRCQGTVLCADTRRDRQTRNPVEPPCGCWQIDALMFRGVCTGCDWEGEPRDREKPAVEDAMDHSWPGWRDQPVVPPMPRDVKPRTRWLDKTVAAYPAGWLEAGGPIRVVGDARDRHVDKHHHPHGGWAMATPIVTVHCFFAPKCKHTEQAESPQAAHDLMDAHYAAKHAAEIDRLTGDWRKSS